MSDKKEITISDKIIKFIVLSLVISSAIIFTIEHYGSYSYIVHSPPQYDSEGRVYLRSTINDPNINSTVYYNTPFETTVTDDSFKSGDIMNYKIDEYPIKVGFIVEAWKQDYKYTLGLTLAIFLIFYFFSKFKIRIT